MARTLNRLLVNERPRVETMPYPDWSKITAAPMEILHGAWAGEQLNRKVPPVVAPAGEPSGAE